MAESISLSVSFTEADYVRVIRFMQGQHFLKKYGFFIVFGVIFVGFLIFVLLLGQDAPQLSIPLAILVSLIPASIVGSVVWLLDRFLNQFILRRTIAKQFRCSPTLREHYHVTIDDTGISSTSNLGSNSVSWEAFIRGVETDSDFLFYASNKFSHFVPKYALTTNDEIELLRTIAKRNLKEKAEF